jgi:hypothetical protein
MGAGMLGRETITAPGHFGVVLHSEEASTHQSLRDFPQIVVHGAHAPA